MSRKAAAGRSAIAGRIGYAVDCLEAARSYVERGAPPPRVMPLVLAPPLAAVAEAAAARQAVEGILGVVVEAARQAGQSWGDIAAQLGVSRQAAWKRYGRTESQ